MNDQPPGIEKTLFEKVYQSSFIGAERVIFTFGAGHPFDLVKTRMQANPAIASGVLLSKEIFMKTGIRGFYTAGIPNLSRALLKESYRSPLRGFIKHHLTNSLPSRLNSVDLINALTGVTLATADTFIICPLERIKVWMMTNYTQKKGMSAFFKQTHSPVDLGKDLFRGLRVSFIRSSASWTSYLLAEEKIRREVTNLSARLNSKSSHLSFSEDLLIGMLGGIVNLLVTQPFDTVKSQIQMQGSISSSSILRTMRSIVNEYGVSGLYSGWKVRLPHHIIAGALTCHVMQEVDKIWNTPR